MVNSHERKGEIPAFAGMTSRVGVTRVEETPDYDALAKFMAAQGLEFDAEDETVPNDILKCWKVTHDGELAGGAILALREGEFICDGIATAPSLRGEGIGKQLLDLLIDEAKSRGGDKLYLVARAPGFFAGQGFEVVPREGAPNFFECFSCPQYGISCHPEVMRLMF
jgi:N-acetylglutamate synthase-like GNAT family acetyltransferase